MAQARRARAGGRRGARGARPDSSPGSGASTSWRRCSRTWRRRGGAIPPGGSRCCSGAPSCSRERRTPRRPSTRSPRCWRSSRRRGRPCPGWRAPSRGRDPGRRRHACSRRSTGPRATRSSSPTSSSCGSRRCAHEEQPAALAELAGLREGAGRLAAAFEARARQYAIEREDPAAEPALRAALCRLADAAGLDDRLAEVLSASVEQGLPEEAAAEVQAALSSIHRSRQSWGPLVAALRGRARLVRDFRVLRDALEGDRRGVGRPAAGRRAEPARPGPRWRRSSTTRGRRPPPGRTARPMRPHAGCGPPASARTGSGTARAPSRPSAPRSPRVPDHAEAHATTEELARGSGRRRRARALLRRGARGPLATAEASGNGSRGRRLRARLAALRDDHLGAPVGALALLEVVSGPPSGQRRVDRRVERAMGNQPDRAGAILERVYAATGRDEPLATLLAARLPQLGDAGGPVALRLGALLEGPLGRPDEAPHFYEEARRIDPALAPRALAGAGAALPQARALDELAARSASLPQTETRAEERDRPALRPRAALRGAIGRAGRAADAYPGSSRRSPAIPPRCGPSRASPRRRRRPSPSCRFACGVPRVAERDGSASARRDAPAPVERRRPGRPGRDAEEAPAARTRDRAGAAARIAEALIAAGKRRRGGEEGRRALALGPAGDAELDRLAAIFRAAGDADDGARVLEARARRLGTGPRGRRGVADRRRRLGARAGTRWRPPPHSPRPSPATRRAAPPSTRFAPSTPT